MSRTILVSIGLASLTLFALLTPAFAYNFNYYYFKTDKLVYEVGESVDMVAKLLAEFSDDGWCYVSFDVKTDQGYVFDDSYMIPSSPDPQYPSSSYLISPADTEPGINGSSAQAIFYVKIFDTLSEERTDTVNFQIIRGHLEVASLSSTTIEYGTNMTLDFQIRSIHSQQIVYPNRFVNVTCTEGNDDSLFSYNTTTSSDGKVSVLWNATTALPGNYNLTIRAGDDSDFEPVAQSFDITVIPAASSINLVQYNDTIYCMDPAGTHIENLTVLVEHIDQAGAPINDSLLFWTTPFSNGAFTNVGSGYYSSSIPFNTTPGLVVVNITSSNPAYQKANRSFEVLVQKRPTQIHHEIVSSPIAGTSLRINVTLFDFVSYTGVSDFTINARLTISGNFSQLIVNQTNNAGIASLAFDLPDNLWGQATLTIFTNSSQFYESSLVVESFNITYYPNVTIKLQTPLILDMNASFHIVVATPLGQPLDHVNVSIYNITGHSFASALTNSNGVIDIFFHLTQISPPTLFLNFSILQNYSLFLHSFSLISSYHVYLPVDLTSQSTHYAITRGNSTSFWFTPVSKYYATNLTLTLYDSLDNWSLTTTADINETFAFHIAINSSASVGTHILNVSIISTTYYITNNSTITLDVFGVITSSLDIFSVYLDEGINANITCIDELGLPLPAVKVSYMFDNSPSLTISNVSTICGDYHLLPLPSSLQRGLHIISLNITEDYYLAEMISLTVEVWAHTFFVMNITIIGSHNDQGSTSGPQEANTSTISSGSIINPPPILFNGTTSTSLETALSTSRKSCPRLSSGTSIRSTVFENSLTIASGNGQTVRNRNSLTLSVNLSSSSSSSAVRDVLPNDIMPHSALSGPETITSERYCIFSRILLLIRLTKSL